MRSSSAPSEARARTKLEPPSNEAPREAAKRNRTLYRLNFQYQAEWQGKFYAIKQVAPVIVEEQNEIVVVTVYTFYF